MIHHPLVPNLEARTAIPRTDELHDVCLAHDSIASPFPVLAPAALETLERAGADKVDRLAFTTQPKNNFGCPYIDTTGHTGNECDEAMGDLAVYNRPGLVSFIAPKLQTISNSAFAGSALRQIDLPSIKYLYGTPFNGMLSLEVINLGPNITVLSQTMLQGTPAGVVVNLPFEEGHFAGAPWGNPDAVINYEVPYAGTVPMPEQEGSGS